jgi:hypothetical protein
MLLSLWLALNFSQAPALAESGYLFRNKQGQATLLPALSVKYETDGYFDKDEQGWCARRFELEIWPNGSVTLHDFFDANGLIRADNFYLGKVIAQTEDTLTLLVQRISLDPQHKGYRSRRYTFDLKTHRLID